MNIVDIIIILIIISGLCLGFKRGLTREVVHFAKFALALVIAFLLKNPLSKLMYGHLPFFEFGGIFKGVTALNIILYEFIAFLLVLGIIMIIFRILLLATAIFEKILNTTVILSLPSKLLGMIVGGIHYYLITFIVLFIVTLPFFKLEDVLKDSKLRDPILNKTPILSGLVDKTVSIIDEFNELGQKYKTENDNDQFNLETIDLFLKYNIITVDSIETLNSKDKLQIDNLESVLNKYR
ncbi:MAG: CvpA family protein [Bacilli bacterium]|nr:CvpA family protein [Bacilli bacterium]MCI9435411.1 CvpA family protein [Bacilli bacterium]